MNDDLELVDYSGCGDYAWLRKERDGLETPGHQPVRSAPPIKEEPHMNLIELPPIWEFPSEVVYRLNVFAIAEGLGLDIRRLAYVREAVQRGVFTDWPRQ